METGERDGLTDSYIESEAQYNDQRLVFGKSGLKSLRRWFTDDCDWFGDDTLNICGYMRYPKSQNDRSNVLYWWYVGDILMVNW